MLRGAWLVVVLVVSTVIFGVPSAIVSMLRPGSDIIVRLGAIWSRWNLRAAGIRPSYEGLEWLPHDRPCVVIANHQSFADIWSLLPVLPLRTRFVAKESLFRIPALGWAMSASGFIAIDRSNRVRAMRSLGMAAERIRAGRSVVLFPEGTRSTDGRLQPFKKGAFHLAVQAGVPVIPVAISGTHALLPPGTLRARPGRVHVRVMPPIDPTRHGPGGAAGLLEEVRAAIVAHLDEPLAGENPPAAAAPAR